MHEDPLHYDPSLLDTTMIPAYPRPTHSRAHLHAPRHIGDKVADAVSAGMGSWKFIIIQSIILALWVIFNTTAIIAHWDGYPFILLNLALSFQAAFAAPFIMISQGRRSMIDAERDNIEAREVHDDHQLLESINSQLSEIAGLLRKDV